MISFEPLFRQLKEKSITRSKFEEMMNLFPGTLTPLFTGKALPNTERIEQMCITLNCSISDVIEWTEEQPVYNNYVKINWDQLQKFVDNSDYSMTSLSSAMGLGKNTLRANRDRNGKVSSRDIKKICELLNCQEEDIEVQ